MAVSKRPLGFSSVYVFNIFVIKKLSFLCLLITPQVSTYLIIHFYFECYDCHTFLIFTQIYIFSLRRVAASAFGSLNQGSAIAQL